jgi:hypothetical protein
VLRDAGDHEAARAKEEEAARVERAAAEAAARADRAHEGLRALKSEAMRVAEEYRQAVAHQAMQQTDLSGMQAALEVLTLAHVALDSDAVAPEEKATILAAAAKVRELLQPSMLGAAADGEEQEEEVTESGTEGGGGVHHDGPFAAAAALAVHDAEPAELNHRPGTIAHGMSSHNITRTHITRTRRPGARGRPPAAALLPLSAPSLPRRPRRSPPLRL